MELVQMVQSASIVRRVTCVLVHCGSAGGEDKRELEGVKVGRGDKVKSDIDWAGEGGVC